MEINRVVNFVHLTYDYDIDFKRTRKEVKKLINDVKRDKRSFGLFFAPENHETSNPKLELELANMFLALPGERSYYIDPVPQARVGDELEEAFKDVKFADSVKMEFYGTYMYLCALQCACDVAQYINFSTEGRSVVGSVTPRGGYEGDTKMSAYGRAIKRDIHYYYPDLLWVKVDPVKPVKI